MTTVNLLILFGGNYINNKLWTYAFSVLRNEHSERLAYSNIDGWERQGRSKRRFNSGGIESKIGRIKVKSEIRIYDKKY
jgi:hypothetical protein